MEMIDSEFFWIKDWTNGETATEWKQEKLGKQDPGADLGRLSGCMLLCPTIRGGADRIVTGEDVG